MHLYEKVSVINIYVPSYREEERNVKVNVLVSNLIKTNPKEIENDRVATAFTVYIQRNIHPEIKDLGIGEIFKVRENGKEGTNVYKVREMEDLCANKGCEEART